VLLRADRISGVRIIGTSIIPAAVSGNISAAVIAVAEKGADLVLEDASRQDQVHAPGSFHSAKGPKSLS
jgi:choline dehydrogenase-like flavoprotein